jgi:hypothetical protein
MAAKKKALRRISHNTVKTFKIKNRSGYAAICLNNLTEGSSSAQAISRLKNPLKRMGYELK